MAERLDPKVLFDLIAAHVPSDLKPNILIVGSLAAAYHFRSELQYDGITTKDADVAIQPAGAIQECQAIAQRLLNDGWRRLAKCYSRPSPTPVEELRAIRLNPPTSDAYFIELLAFPEAGQKEFKKWIPFKVADGWYCLPSFRFLALTAYGRERSENGLMYAAPAMMALANLLSHPVLGAERMSEPVGDRTLLRSTKDLGRVLALARLTSRDETETWAAKWEVALRAAFPEDYSKLAERAGDGLRALLEDSAALEEARHAVDVGLLAGYQVTGEQLRALGRQLLADAVEPLRRRCATE